MAESVHQASNGAKPPLKRPLFAKPTWAQSEDLGNSTDFFRRSNQSYVNIAAEAERKRQKKLARRQREQAHQSQSTEPAEKRRRISIDSDSDNDSDGSKIDEEAFSEREQDQSSTYATASKPGKGKQSPNPPEPKSLPNSLSKTYEIAITAKKDQQNQPPPSSNIIELDDDDGAPEADQDEIIEVTAAKRPKSPQDDDDFPPSDDEFAELARQAREKVRRKRLEADILSPTPDSLPSRTQDDHLNRFPSVHEPTPPPDPPDSIVSILITSSISNTEPLIVNRKISQRLKDVRLCWCQRQGFTEEMTEKVFLTWRGQRLFDVTTCSALGIGVDSNGNIVTKVQRDVLGEEERQVHMEAMTKEILEERQRLERLGATRIEKPDETEAQEEEPLAEKKEPQVRIILKAKGYDDFKLIVKPVSTCSGPEIFLRRHY